MGQSSDGLVGCVVCLINVFENIGRKELNEVNWNKLDCSEMDWNEAD